MTPNRKILGAAAFSLALAGGGVAGAMLGTPSTSLAQHTSATATSADPAADGRGPGRFAPRGEALAIAAEVLGMSEDDLKAALTDGSSIADVAADQGVDVQDVIDALVADASARLDELQAELPDRMTELVQRTGWGEHRPRHRPGVVREGAPRA